MLLMAHPQGPRLTSAAPAKSFERLKETPGRSSRGPAVLCWPKGAGLLGGQGRAPPREMPRTRRLSTNVSAFEKMYASLSLGMEWRGEGVKSSMSGALLDTQVRTRARALLSKEEGGQL